jgi:hypothetical protein
MNRRVAAGVILGLWVLVVAWHIRREYFRPEAERFALAARTLPPGVAYYALYRGDRRAGWAQSEMDTLPAASGFLLRDRVSLNLPGMGPQGESETTTEAWYGPGLELDSLNYLSVIAADSVRVSGRMSGDSLLLVRVASGGDISDAELGTGGPLSLTTAWPLRMAAEERARPGDTYAVRLFDPATRSIRDVEIRVLERRLRTYPDSADTDSLTGAWIAVRHDTVQAWSLEQSVGELALASWVDEDGRFLAAELPGDLRLERTAFELAFFTRERRVPE